MDLIWCVRTIQRVCSDLSLYTDGRYVDLTELDSHSAQLQLVYRASWRASRSGIRLCDADLDAIVAEILLQFPTCGNRQMLGYLLARGVRVQQHRVREAQRRVDPSGSIMRRLFSINRRTYQVNGPLALWHIDGNHKMIRYAYA